MIYYLTFFSAFLFAYISKQYKNKLKIFFFIISGFILVILAAMRSETVGIDVLVYVKRNFLIAQKIDNIFSYLKSVDIEPLYLIVTFYATKIFGNLQAVLFFNELIIIGFTYAAIWNLKDEIQIDIAVIAFCFMFYGHSLNITRQTMAAAVVLYAFNKLLKGEWLKALVFWIISIGFHYSAVVCICIYLIYLLDKFNLSKKIKIFFLFLLISFQLFYEKIFIFFVMHISFLPRRYISSTYLYREYNISSSNLILYIFCALLALMLLIRKKPMRDFWYFVVCLSVCGVFIAAKAMYANRIFYYFEYLLFLMLSRKDIFPVKQTRGNAIVCNGILCLILAVHFYIFQIYLNLSGIFPYRSIL